MKIALLIDTRHSKGYIQVGREIAHALKRRSDIEVAVASSCVPAGNHNDWRLKQLLEPVESFDDFDAVVYSAEGDRAHLIPPAKKRVAYFAHECEPIPGLWVRRLNRVDAGLCISRFVKEAAERSGVTIPLYNIPNGVDSEFYRPDVPPLPLYQAHRRQDPETFVFCANGFFGPRKAFDAVIRSFSRAFKGNPHVHLFIHAIGATRVCKSFYGCSLKEWADALDPHPNVVIHETGYSDEQIPRMYAACDAYVSFGREGFGLPGLEAMACGLPTVLLGWGGQLEYANELNSYLVKSRGMERADIWPDSERPLQYHGLEWAAVDEDDAVERFRECHNKNNWKQRGDVADNGLATAREMTWDWAASKFVEALKQITGEV